MPTFEKGKFKNYRSTTKIHLGKLNIYLEQDQIIGFDGQTLKFDDGAQHTLPQLRGAVNSEWLVPEEDTTTTYVPKPADIQIRPADRANEEKKTTKMSTKLTHDEERVVGRVKSAGQKEEAAVSATEGVAVGRIESPTKRTTTITDTSQVNTEINKMDNKKPPNVIKTQPTEGENLTDLVTDAAIAGVVTNAPNVIKTPSKVTLLGNGDQWDMARHWRTRGKDAVAKYANNPTVLSEIKKAEIPSVVKFINKKMEKTSS